ncbi:MAG: heme exporter protein CcmB [Myxococcota bacterium]|jgi:heme exporter protein B|nr:heme exporter protein CcmB [Myxococcota bacterium]
MSTTLAILWKDLVTEWRSRDRVIAMLLFSLLVVVIFHFALPVGTRSGIQENAAGLLWVAYVFAANIGLNRSFALELENDALSLLALAPGERGWIFLGKALANLILIGLVEAAAGFAFAVAFDIDLLKVALPLAGVVLLGTFGLCCAGTLFSAMSVRTRLREVLLPILLLPALFPVLAGAVAATRDLIVAGEASFEAIQLLLVIDGVYLVVSFLGFEYILDE